MANPLPGLIWPTTQATGNRASYANYVTDTSHVDWTFLLSSLETPTSSGTSSRSWDFDTTAEGWASSGIGITRWDGSDGDPSPGCLQGSCIQDHNGINFDSQPFVGGPTWGDWGVPVHGIVTSVDVSLFAKYGGAIAFPEGDSADARIQTTSGSYTLFTIPDARTLTNWTAYSGTVTLPGTDVWAYFATLALFATPNNHMVNNVLIDHVQMTIHWTIPVIKEHFVSPPVVSKSGYIWCATQDNAPYAPQSWIIAVDSSGSLLGHFQLIDDFGRIPTPPTFLTTDENDHLYVVYNDGVAQYSSDGTQNWYYNFARTGPPSFSVAQGDDDLIYAVETANFTGNTTVDALTTGGVLDHTFDTGGNSTSIGFHQPVVIEGSYLYFAMQVFPGGHLHMRKVDKTTGTVAWSIDMTGVGNGFNGGVGSPAVFNGHVVFYAAYDGVTGDVCLISLKDLDGSTEWIYDNANTPIPELEPPSIASDGTVYTSLNGVTPDCVVALNGSTGAVKWTYTDAAENIGSASPYPVSIGGDGYLLVPRKSLVRLKASDGSVDRKTNTNETTFSPALSNAHTYFCDSSNPGVLYAYGPAPGAQARSSSDGVARATLTNIASPVGGGPIHATSRGVISHALLIDFCQSAIEVYLAGAESGDDLTTTAYSLPTVFTLPNPALSGHNYILQLPATDLAKFASGRLGFVKFRYAGNATRDCAGDVVLGGIELIYNEKTVS